MDIGLRNKRIICVNKILNSVYLKQENKTNIKNKNKTMLYSIGMTNLRFRFSDAVTKYGNTPRLSVCLFSLALVQLTIEQPLLGFGKFIIIIIIIIATCTTYLYK